MRIESPYGTRSWNLDQARRSAVLTTLITVPLVLYLMIGAFVVDNLGASMLFVILSVLFILATYINWMRVRSIERANYGDGPRGNGV